MADRTGLLNKIAKLAGLNRGWDGSRADPIEPELIESALAFAFAFVDHMPGDPIVTPMCLGRLQFEWHRGGRMLEIEFDEPGRIHYLKWAGLDTDDTAEDVIPIAGNSRAIIALFRWFATEPTP